MKNLLLSVILAAAPAAAQEFAADMPAMNGILAKTRALKASEKTINEALWSAREAYRTEPNPERKAQLRAQYDHRLNAVLAAAGKELGDHSPASAAVTELDTKLRDCWPIHLSETDPSYGISLQDTCVRTLDWSSAGADKAEASARTLAPLAYDPREIRFEALETTDKTIGIYHKEQRLATLHVGGMMTGKHVVFRLIGYLESSRQRAIGSGRKVSIDDAAISLYNETGFLSRKALAEPERFAAIIRVTDETVP
jgi:hypothetical protein